MKSIIVPVNFSACASNAARYAAALALAVKADLHLIHVIQVPVTTAEMNMTEYVYREILEAANTSLKQMQAELTKHTHGKVKVEIIIESGSIAAKVKDLCGELDTYAIVLGAAGPTLEKFLTGSPVSSLLRHLTYPVLVVPVTATFQQFRRILLAFDLDDIGAGLPHSLPLLKDLRGHFGSRFDIVTVKTPAILANERSVSQSNAWKEQLEELYPEIYYIRNNNVEEGILEYLGEHDADLVMVFPKKHGLFDFHISQSRKLARHSPIPVMSLHE